jgi:hypothetical protein
MLFLKGGKSRNSKWMGALEVSKKNTPPTIDVFNPQNIGPSHLRPGIFASHDFNGKFERFLDVVFFYFFIDDQGLLEDLTSVQW